VEHYDDYISAEIPDPVTHPRLHRIVTGNMVHTCELRGCASNGCCDKGFPAPYCDRTHVDPSSIRVNYRRRSPENGGRSFQTTSGRTITNQDIVPYSPVLSLLYDAHINVQFATSARTIKYLFLYLHVSLRFPCHIVRQANIHYMLHQLLTECLFSERI
jgi:hypothetical protein